jgi:putative oxidoreductase
MNEFWTSWQPKALSLLRFMSGFLMFWHGTQKIFGFPPSEFKGEVPAFIQYGAGGIELVAGFFLIIGLFSRWSAFLLSGTMAVAYWLAHGMNAFLPIQNKGELAALYCFVYLFLFFAGGGSISVDKALNKEW